MSAPAALSPAARETQSGLVAGLAAYLLWGFLPLLFGALKAVGAATIVADRTLWSLLFVGAVILFTQRGAEVKALLGDLRRLRTTQLRGGSTPRAVAALSAREVEVARGVLAGRTHREIGAQLYISAKTVEHHVARVRQKLGATTRAELLAAIRDELAVGAER